jgi:cyclic pyranopterin phosphate synthase
MLKDKFKRKINYLRVSLTDKCNLRCVYCIPAEGVELLPHDEVLRNEEFLHFIGIFVDLGVEKIRFTGGEPLVRRGVVDIIAKTRELHSDIELCLTTNGILLDEVLDDIYRTRVKKLNISLDTMSAERYKEITGRNLFKRVISNIERAISYNYFDIKINAVLFKESADELDSFLDYFKDKDVTLRFIEKMPFLEENMLNSFLSSDEFMRSLRSKGHLIRNEDIDTNVAEMFELQYRDKYAIRIGVIPTISHKFCSRCNRLRLTCDGSLKTCLNFPVEYDLKTPYRMDMGDDAIRDIIVKAVAEKPEAHKLDGYYGNDGCSSIAYVKGRTMSKIGG